MPSLTATEFGDSLARCFDSLWEFRQQFERNVFNDYDHAARDVSLYDEKFLPNFEIRNGRIVGRQASYFTVFPYAVAVVEFLTGLEQLSAYSTLEREDYDQFANFVSCSNTSEFRHP
jgi:hypothetical protein